MEDIAIVFLICATVVICMAMAVGYSIYELKITKGK